MFGFLCVIVLALLVVYVFFLVTCQTALSRVSPHNRAMEPGMVWLMFVPCVNIVWGFILAIRVPDSLKKELEERGQDDGSDYGKSAGLAAWTLNLANGFISNIM